MAFSASKDKTFVRFWFLTIDDDVKPYIPYEETADFIDAVLQHPEGWSKHGYVFERIQADEGLIARRKRSNYKYVLHLRVSTADTVKKACNFGGLSCANLKDNIVYFNKDRWLHGSKESGLSLDAYRVYVVCHEVGHLLDRGHKKCSNDINEACPIMYQQTISKGCCKPNIWPLDWE
jgi:predicted Zn-dependent protease